MYFVEEPNGEMYFRQLIWTLDDSFVKDQEQEKWYDAQVQLEAPNHDKNYRVRNTFFSLSSAKNLRALFYRRFWKRKTFKIGIDWQIRVNSLCGGCPASLCRVAPAGFCRVASVFSPLWRLPPPYVFGTKRLPRSG